MRKIVFVAQNFNIGGIQRALVNLVKELDNKKEVKSIILCKIIGTIFHDFTS
ncbi:MAG: hypothetical protein GX451_00685 [Acholeplasmataceae bacterium]|nr:hypothetical protein [Acholeplasmataceae bacterium]